MARDAGPTERDLELNELLRSLPSVEELAARLPELPHAIAVASARRAVHAARERLLAGGEIGDLVAEAL